MEVLGFSAILGWNRSICTMSGVAGTLSSEGIHIDQ